MAHRRRLRDSLYTEDRINFSPSRLNRIASTRLETSLSGVGGTSQDNYEIDAASLNSVSSIITVVQRYLRLLETPLSYNQLRTHPVAVSLFSPLTELLQQCHFPGTVFSVIACIQQIHKASGKPEDGSVEESRALACEIIAIRVLRCLSGVDIIRALTMDFETPSKENQEASNLSTSQSTDTESQDATSSSEVEDSKKLSSAMELAILVEAKFFLNSPAAQRTISDIWCGDVMFYSSIDVEGYRARKEVSMYRWTDTFWCGYARLRVPRYRFVFQELNFAVLLALFLAVLRDESEHVSFLEVVLDIWFTGFVYDEYAQLNDSGSVALYAANPWSFFDGGMVVVFLSWLIARMVDLFSEGYDSFPYDVLSLEALFLVPRVFSTLSLFPYYGILIPTLRELTKDFFRFLIIIIVLFAGFLVTFLSLGRNTFNLHSMFWLVVRIFFGSTYLGFDAMYDINPIFGPPLMVIFCILCNFLLLTVLISILSNSFARHNSREQFGFIFAVACAESISSDHLAVFLPPLNLIPLLILRPMRIFLPSKHRYIRQIKFALLRVTHAPFVLGVSLYEHFFCAFKRHTGHRQAALRPPLSSVSGRSSSDPRNPPTTSETEREQLESASAATPANNEPETDSKYESQLEHLSEEVRDLKETIQQLIQALK